MCSHSFVWITLASKYPVCDRCASMQTCSTNRLIERFVIQGCRPRVITTCRHIRFIYNLEYVSWSALTYIWPQTV